VALSSAGLRLQLLWQGSEAIVQQITDLSSRQRGRYKITNRNCLKEINWSWVSDGCLTPRQTGHLMTVRRKLTSTSTSDGIRTVHRGRYNTSNRHETFPTRPLRIK
jgi:hypothetical protein